MTKEFKPEKTIEDVYVASVTRDHKVILQARNYDVLMEVPVAEFAGFLLEEVCVCSSRESSDPADPVLGTSYWFCVDDAGKYATAELWDEGGGKKQVVMRQPKSPCGRHW